MRSATKLRVFILVVALTLPSATAFACSCAPPPGPTKSLEVAAGVVEARAVAGPSMQADDWTVEYQFEVLRTWKGDFGRSLTVETASESATCGRMFSIGTTYILYLQNVRGDRASDYLCSRTRPSERALEDLTALGEGTATSGSRDTSGAATTRASEVDGGGPAGSAEPPAPNEATSVPGETVAESTVSPETATSSGDGAEDSKEPSTSDTDEPTCSVSGPSAPNSLLFLVLLLLGTKGRRRA
jgi:hypothetical protein